MIRLTVHLSGRIIERKEFVGASRLAIGRASASDLVLDNAGVSRTHCEIIREGRVFTLCDAGSNNGTFVNGKRITVRYLNDGDSITIGKFTLDFEEDPPPGKPRVPDAKAARGEGAPEDDCDPETAKESDTGYSADFDATMTIGAKDMEARLRNQEKRARGYLVDLGKAGGEPFILEKAITVLGTSKRADLPAKGFWTSAKHALIVRDEAGYFLVDTHRKSRVRLNGSTCDIERLHDGDEIHAGDRRLRFMVGTPAERQSLGGGGTKRHVKGDRGTPQPGGPTPAKSEK